MKRKKKPKQEYEFPDFLTLSFDQIQKDNLIITDAGRDQIPYQLALQFFPFERIFDWWSSYDVILPEAVDFVLSELESELPSTYQSISQSEILRIIEKLLRTYDWLPPQVPVLIAKAIYQEQRWLMLIDLDDEWANSQGFDSYEETAIKLGNLLKKELEDDSLIVVNDNQNAVKAMNGFSSFIWLDGKEWAKDLANQPYSVLWIGREFVREADRLKVEDANRIFSPDALDDYNMDIYFGEDD